MAMTARPNNSSNATTPHIPSEAAGRRPKTTLSPTERAHLVTHVRTLEDYGKALDTEAVLLGARVRLGRDIPREQEARVAKLERRGQALGLGNDPRRAGGTRVARGLVGIL